MFCIVSKSQKKHKKKLSPRKGAEAQRKLRNAAALCAFAEFYGGAM
jgi:hypothetical protein